MTPPPDKKKNLLLRIDPVLWNDLNAMAADELRSLNGQIEYLLRQSVRKWKRESGGGDSSPPPEKDDDPIWMG